MKKYLILLLVTVSLSFYACEDMLDLSPTQNIHEEMVFQSEAMMRAYLNELYWGIPSEFSYTYQRAPEWTSRATDEVFNNARSGYIITTGSLNEDNVNTLSEMKLYIWNSSYQYIRKLNIFLNELENADFLMENKDQMVAEAKAIKAFIYFNMIIRFGGVPIVDDYWNLHDEKTFTSNTLEECVTEIERLIAEAMPDLDEYYSGSSANYGKICQDVLLALRSRMYLYLASPLFAELHNPNESHATKWQRAATAAEDFFSATGNRYQLHPNYARAFNNPNGVINPEFIFVKNFTETQGHNVPIDNLGRRYGGYSGWWASMGPSQNLVDDYDMQSTGLPPFTWNADGTKSVNPASGYDLQNPYADRDPRFYATVIYDGAVYRGDLHEFWVSQDGKQWGQDSPLQNGDNPVGLHLMRKFAPDLDQEDLLWGKSTITYNFSRLGEIYLNYAEAMFELGNEDVCREYMNKIRARAQMPDIPDTVTGEELRARLYNERRIELAFEMHRYFDVRRWKIAHITENRDIYGAQIIKNMTTGEKTYSTVLRQVRKGSWDDRYYLLPIHRDEIQRNTGSLLQTVTWR